MKYALLIFSFWILLASPAGAWEHATTREELAKYQLRAKQGDAMGQHLLGMEFESGRLLPKDLATAAKWQQKAASQGLRYAQFELAELYYEGKGVKQDFVEAAKWYRLAAEQRVFESQFKLGTMYASGKGVPLDKTEAYFWMSLSTQWQVYEDRFGPERDNVGKSLSSEQIAQVRQRVWEWRPTRSPRLLALIPKAIQGDIVAQRKLASAYFGGGVGPDQDRDEAEAMKWYRIAAEQGDGVAQANLGRLYVEGLNVPRNPREGMAWILFAAQRGVPEAQALLGRLYFDRDEYTPRNYVESYFWYSLAAVAAKNGDPKRMKMYKNSQDRMARRITPEQIAAAQKRVQEWKPKPCPLPCVPRRSSP